MVKKLEGGTYRPTDIAVYRSHRFIKNATTNIANKFQILLVYDKQYGYKGVKSTRGKITCGKITRGKITRGKITRGKMGV